MFFCPVPRVHCTALIFPIMALWHVEIYRLFLVLTFAVTILSWGALLISSMFVQVWMWYGWCCLEIGNRWDFYWFSPWAGARAEVEKSHNGQMCLLQLTEAEVHFPELIICFTFTSNPMQLHRGHLQLSPAYKCFYLELYLNLTAFHHLLISSFYSCVILVRFSQNFPYKAELLQAYLSIPG